MFGGQDVYKILGVHFDTDREIEPPNFSEHSEWECAFIQSKSSDRMLEPNTLFLYCKLILQMNNTTNSIGSYL